MNGKAARLFTRLQNELLQLLTELDKQEPSLLEKSPAPGIWSVTQVMHHLNSAELLSIKYVSKKCLGAGQLERTKFEAQLRLVVARIANYLPFKYRAPQVLGEMSPHVAYAEIKQSWLQTRKE